MNKIKAVIFDWSGTLSDDVALCLDADNRLLARHDRPPITMHEFIRYYTTPDLVGFYEREFGLRFSSQEELHREYEEAMRASPLKPKPYPRAGETLAALKNAGARLFVVSAHPKSVLEEEARGYGFRDFFDARGVIGSVWDKTDSLKRLITENKFASNDALFVGDVILDIRAGKAAGVRTCACAYGYHPRAWLEKEKPNFLISDVSELLKVVGVEGKPNGE